MSGSVRSLRPSRRWKGRCWFRGVARNWCLQQVMGARAGCPHPGVRDEPYPDLNLQEKKELVLLEGGGRESSWGRGQGRAPPF